MSRNEDGRLVRCGSIDVQSTRGIPINELTIFFIRSEKTFFLLFLFLKLKMLCVWHGPNHLKSSASISTDPWIHCCLWKWTFQCPTPNWDRKTPFASKPPRYQSQRDFSVPVWRACVSQTWVSDNLVFRIAHEERSCADGQQHLELVVIFNLIISSHFHIVTCDEGLRWWWHIWLCPWLSSCEVPRPFFHRRV